MQKCSECVWVCEKSMASATNRVAKDYKTHLMSDDSDDMTFSASLITVRFIITHLMRWMWFNWMGCQNVWAFRESNDEMFTIFSIYRLTKFHLQPILQHGSFFFYFGLFTPARYFYHPNSSIIFNKLRATDSRFLLLLLVSARSLSLSRHIRQISTRLRMFTKISHSLNGTAVTRKRQTDGAHHSIGMLRI